MREITAVITNDVETLQNIAIELPVPKKIITFQLAMIIDVLERIYKEMRLRND